MTNLDGTAAIITGASRGIGLGIAHHLVSRGARVCLTARNEAALREAVDDLGGPQHATYVVGNSDDDTHQHETIAHVRDTFGDIGVLINNAGINPVYGPLLDLDLKAARKVVEVNCLSAIAWTQKVVRSGMDERGGAIVNVSSTAGLLTSPGIAFYGASKAMLSHLTKELSIELAPRIRVNAVAPAVVKTKFAAALYEGREEQVASSYPLQRLGTPDDIGEAVAFLVSDAAAWITGQTIVIDGGLTVKGAE